MAAESIISALNSLTHEENQEGRNTEEKTKRVRLLLLFWFSSILFVYLYIIPLWKQSKRYIKGVASTKGKEYYSKHMKIKLGFFIFSFLPRASHPERTESSEAVEILRHGQQTPCRLSGGQDLLQPVNSLVPQIVRL